MISHGQHHKPIKTYQLSCLPRINMLKEERPEDHESQLLAAAEATAEVRHIGVSMVCWLRQCLSDLSIYLFIYLSIYLSIHPSMYLSIHPSIYLVLLSS